MIPAILVAVVMIAGVFAFMPVEKASTVHSTLATSAGQTTAATAHDAGGTIQTNTDAEADGQDRAINFFYNMSHFQGADGTTITNFANNATIVRGIAGETLTGYATLTATTNNSKEGAAKGAMVCGLSTTGQGPDGPDPRELGINATGGLSNFTTFSTANGLTAGEGIMVQLTNGTGVTTIGMGGVCAGTIVLTNWGS